MVLFTPITTVMLTGRKVMFSCFAFASCMPGGMIISEEHGGRTKSPLLVVIVVSEA
jgi:hypothetical protein